MNELLIIGMLVSAFSIMFAITTVIENIDVIIGYITSRFVALGEWFFDLGTAYYKFKNRRRSR